MGTPRFAIDLLGATLNNATSPPGGDDDPFKIFAARVTCRSKHKALL
jgi:hypothetical protein